MAYFGQSKEKNLSSTYLIVLVGAILTAGWLLLPVEFGSRPIAAIFMTMFWPGVAWASFSQLWPTEKLTGEALLLSVAGSLAILLAIILAVTNLGQEIPIVLLISLPLLLTLFPIIVHLFFRKEPSIQFKHDLVENWLWFLLPLAIALILRLPWFGYREIQGDEGIVLVRAADALLGDGAELLLHRKGPMEILLAMSVWGAAGKINDFWVRLPFLLCNIFSLALFFRLSDRWFGRKVAMLAGCLLAIVGFHVAFSRVVQYQSLVMMWGIGALLAAERYRETGRKPDLILVAILLAAGLLSHYDAVLFVPAILTLLMSRWYQAKEIPIKAVATAAGTGLLMLSLFYIPFLLGPDFQNAIGYLLNERVDTSAGGSLADVWQMVTFYNSSWAIIGFGGFALVGFYALWRLEKPSVIKIGGALFLLVPLLFYTVIVSVPRTHVYTFFPGLVLVAALGIDKIAELRRPNVWLYRLGWGGFAIWFLVCASYIFLLFTWGPGEVQRHWDSLRPNTILFWTTWDKPPTFGLFGFPYQAGWRELGQSNLDGLVYASNEEEEITNWYMAQAARTHCDIADLFLLSENVQDPIAFNPILTVDKAEFEISENLSLFATDRFDFHLGSRMFTPAEISKPRFGGLNPLDVPLGERVTLAGYDISIKSGHVEAVLYWDVKQAFDRNYQAFVHVIDQDGNLVTQHDSAPECGINPTTRWEP
ncbi:MAG: ArnT family glycosyltransferase, partial [Anaerolineae bacterium]